MTAAADMRRIAPADAGFPLIDRDIDPPIEQLWVRGRPLEELGRDRRLAPRDAVWP